MLVPITFKADGGDSSKKGKIRADDLSALFAFSLPKKTGILQLLNECNIYGYPTTVTGGRVTVYFHSGYVVICGRAVYVEEGSYLEIDLPASGSIAGSIGIKVQLGQSGQLECDWYYRVMQSGDTLRKDDLNNNPTGGIYEFELYSYSATISGGSATFSTNKTADVIAERGDDTSKSAIYTATRAGEIDTIKTIDEKIEELRGKISALGFERVVLSGFSGNANATYSFYRAGNIVYANSYRGILTDPGNMSAWAVGGTIFTLPAAYRPVDSVQFCIAMEDADRKPARLFYCTISSLSGACTVDKVSVVEGGNIRLNSSAYIRYSYGYAIANMG